MQVGTGTKATARKRPQLLKADRPPQCNQVKNKVEWKNKKFSFNVCAEDAKKAAAKVTPAMINNKIEADAKAAVKVDCSEITSCGDTQDCLEQDPVFRTRRVTRGPSAALCRPDPAATCAAPETGWICDIWADVVVEQQCGCGVA